MLQGDSLSVLLFLASVAISAVLGAIATPAGKAHKSLIAIALFFGVAALVWLLAPAAGPVTSTIRSVAHALLQSGAPLMIATVSIVALMQAKGKTSVRHSNDGNSGEVGQPNDPPEFAYLGTHSKWSPDITLREAFRYFYDNSGERGYRESQDDTYKKFIKSIRDSKITSWGKEHPSDEAFFQIAPRFWLSTKATFETDFVFSEHLNCGAYDVRFSSEEMNLIWPAKS